MPDGPETTTVELKVETWAALDKRKDRGESFDDVVRRLINNTAAPMGAIKEDDGFEFIGREELDDPPAGAGCSHYDTIAEETCGDEPAYLETVRYGEDGDDTESYLCEKHGGPEEPVSSP